MMINPPNRCQNSADEAFALLTANIFVNLLLLCSASPPPRPGALLGGEWSGAGPTRQRKRQSFGQDERLPEPGAGGLGAQESIEDRYEPGRSAAVGTSGCSSCCCRSTGSVPSKPFWKEQIPQLRFMCKRFFASKCIFALTHWRKHFVCSPS